MRGQNLMGVTQFSVFADGLYPSSGWNMLNGGSSNTVQPGQTNPGTGTPGFVSLYYNGSSYNGPAFSVLDPGGNQIGSVFYTYKAGGAVWNPGQTNTNPVVFMTNVLITNTSYTTNQSLVIITNYSTNDGLYSQYTSSLTTNASGTNSSTNITIPYVFVSSNPLSGLVISDTAPLTSNNWYWAYYTNRVSTNISVVYTNTSITNNALSPYGLNGGYNYYDGYWNATLQNKYPNQVFYGNGAASLGQSGNPTDPSPINTANGTATVRQIPFSVQGTRVSSSTSQIY